MTANYPDSPPWSATSKRLVLLVLLAVSFLAIYRMRTLLLPLVMAFVVAYLVEPMVKGLVKQIRIKRIFAIVLVYLVILTTLISIPVSAISPLIAQVSSFINNTPGYLELLGEFLQEPLVLAGREIPIDQLPLEQVYTGLAANLINIVQTVGGRSLGLFSSIASATITTVGWTILVLFLSFYIVRDHDSLFGSVMEMVPPAYQSDIRHLSGQISVTWNAFLRGQLVLSMVMGLIVFVLALILGLPNPLVLAIIGGLAEFLPTVGPILAAIPATLLALFQSDASWLGHLMSPLWFGVVVLSVYGIIYQFENYYLVPRIIGHHLKLHPLVVVVGALAGASVAGLLGIMLAAPTLATGRLIFLYIYCKLTDRPPFPDVVVAVEEIEINSQQLTINN